MKKLLVCITMLLLMGCETNEQRNNRLTMSQDELIIAIKRCEDANLRPEVVYIYVSNKRPERVNCLPKVEP